MLNPFVRSSSFPCDDFQSNHMMYSIIYYVRRKLRFTESNRHKFSRSTQLPHVGNSIETELNHFGNFQLSVQSIINSFIQWFPVLPCTSTLMKFHLLLEKLMAFFVIYSNVCFGLPPVLISVFHDVLGCGLVSASIHAYDERDNSSSSCQSANKIQSKSTFYYHPFSSINKLKLLFKSNRECIRIIFFFISLAI